MTREGTELADGPSKLLEDLLLKTSRTFALSIPRLPQPTRHEVGVAYLLFRIADTLEDATRWDPKRQIEALGEFSRLLEQPQDAAAADLGRRWTADPPLLHEGYLELLSELSAVMRAFSALAPRARELVGHHTLRTIERMTGFVERARVEGRLQLIDVAELKDYCYAVAGIVGEMLTELFLLRRECLQPVATELRRHASIFGEALQLVNILKDSATDVDEGRRYLPPDVDASDVLDLAHRDLDAAREYVLALQSSGAERGLVEFAALPVLLAHATLDRVRKHGSGSKLSRLEVAAIVRRLGKALNEDLPAIP